jgi:hypothetical protein
MTKVIDIRTREIKQEPIRVVGADGTVTISNKAGLAPEATTAPKILPRKNFIIRFLDIMLYDILCKIGRKPETEDAMKWEDYERFCQLVRGGKK